jgi:3-oxoacyl-[acyl-carrier-protein] synthase-3
MSAASNDPRTTSTSRGAANRLASVIVATGAHIPERRKSGQDFLAHRFFAPDGEPFDPDDNPRTVAKFEAITEISERRYADDDQLTSDLATLAAEDALRSSGIDRESLDYLIVAHNFGDVAHDNRRSELVPTLAARVKHNLRIETPECVAYDLPFGCPGWLQGMIQADYFLRSGDARRALVIGAEILSRVSDPHDRDSMIYADGAGAVILEAQPSDGRIGILAHAARSDTIDHAHLLRMGPSSNPSASNGDLYLKMEGRKLYEYALQTVPDLVARCLTKAEVPFSEVSKVLLHQANGKMDRAMLKRLYRVVGVQQNGDGVLPMTVADLGNSSVATLPTMLDLMLKGRLDGHEVASGDVLVFASVGAGMNVNALVYRCPDQAR